MATSWPTSLDLGVMTVNCFRSPLLLCCCLLTSCTRVSRRRRLAAAEDEGQAGGGGGGEDEAHRGCRGSRRRRSGRSWKQQPELVVVLDGDAPPGGAGGAVRGGPGGGRRRPHLHERVRLQQLHEHDGPRARLLRRSSLRSLQLIDRWAWTRKDWPALRSARYFRVNGWMDGSICRAARSSSSKQSSH